MLNFLHTQNKKYLLLGSFAVFGFIALVYQVVFARNLVPVFGLTAPAVATILAVYFSGLALGSLLVGRVVDRLSANAINRIYVWLFLLVGVFGFLSPFLFKLISFLVVSVNKIYPLNFAGFNIFTFFFSFLFLIIPSIVIGGGFPIINKIFSRLGGGLGRNVSLLYFVETLGNVLGAVSAGFVLIPALGNRATIFLTAGLSLLIGGFLYLYFRKAKGSHTEIQDIKIKETLAVSSTSSDENSAKRSGIQNPIFVYALFATGFLSLALEVLYTKTLVLFIGSSTYAFSLILITFLLGIALGSWAVSFFLDSIKRGSAYFGLFLGLIGFWLFLTLQFFEKVPFWYLNMLKSYESFEFSAILSTQSFIAFITIFPATFLMGMAFPLGIKLAAPDLNKFGSSIGGLYSANTFGGVLGSLLAGFLLLPMFGYSKSLSIILVSYLLIGSLFIAREGELERVIKISVISFLVFFGIFSIFSSPWSKKTLTVGSFVYAPSYISFGEDVLRETIQSDDIIYYNEGYSNIAVVRRGPNLLLKINSKVDASNTLEDLESEILAGVLPMIFHPEPKEILVVGLGSGITLGSISRFDSAENIDVAEIDPAIIEAAGYFKKENNDVLNNPRVRIAVSDGRNHLLLSDKKYDVISSHPSNIWFSGNAYLFTREYYELAKSRLNENGLMLQWIQAYSLSPNDIKSVFKTFQEVFPRAYLFNSANSGDLFLIGSPDTESDILDLKELKKKFNDEKIKQELERVYIMSPYELIAYLVSGGPRLKVFAENSSINSDDKNFLEFSAPKSIYLGTTSDVLKEIDYLRSEVDLSIFGITEGETKEVDQLKKHFEFRRALLPVQAALTAGDLFSAAGIYKDAAKSGVRQLSVEANILRRCNVAALIAQQSGSSKDAERIWEKCGEVFNTIEAGYER